MEVQIGQLQTLGWNGVQLNNVSISPVGESLGIIFSVYDHRLGHRGGASDIGFLRA